jgi:hypothetical protein
MPANSLKQLLTNKGKLPLLPLHITGHLNVILRSLERNKWRRGREKDSAELAISKQKEGCRGPMIPHPHIWMNKSSYSPGIAYMIKNTRSLAEVETNSEMN